MKKTIWVINQFAGTPESGWGERHYYFSRYWVKKGYKVIVLSASYSHMFKNQPITNGKKYTIQKIGDDLSYCWVKINKYSGGGIVSKLWAGIMFSFNTLFIPKNLLSKPDFVIVSSPPIFSSITGWFLKVRFKAKSFIFEIRDLWPLTPMYLKGYKKWHPVILVMSILERIGYKKSNYVVSLLPNAYPYINNITKNPEKFKWIPNGIDEALLENEPLSECIINKIPKNKFIIGYAGTMGMANALEYFTESSNLLTDNKNIHFVLVGDGYLKKKLLEITEGNDNITFIQKINKNQVQNILRFFDICFIGRNNTPLFNYGVSSNKYFDYMLAKKPVLVSSNRIKDPVELSGCGIIVPPENAEAIKEGILKLYNIPKEELEKMGQKGYEYVKKYHNFDYLSDKYIKLF